MKICVFGAGAIGSYIGGNLASDMNDVTLIARGNHCRAMKNSGLIVSNNEGEMRHVSPKIYDNISDVEKQDVVFVCVKSQDLPKASADIAAISHDNTLVIYCLNGMPWWYFQGIGGVWESRTLSSLDPDERIKNTLNSYNTIGCVIYSAATIIEPGHVKYIVDDSGNTPPLFIGETNNKGNSRLDHLKELMSKSGIPTNISDDIRSEIWHKLWGNIAMNPISALTHATMDEVVEKYNDIDLVESVMNEARFIAEKIGISFSGRPEDRIVKAAKLKGHKTSMLQDIEMGRPTEIEAIVGAVREIGKMVEVDTPYLNTLYSLVKQKERFYKTYRK